MPKSKPRKKSLNKKKIRVLIQVAYEDLLKSMCRNKYGDEPTEQPLPGSERTEKDKYIILSDICRLSYYIVDDIVERVLKDQKKYQSSHDKIKGIDNYKQAGLLTFWISKLKPVIVVTNIPDYFEIPIEFAMLINEYLAVKVATGILYSKFNEILPFSEKLVKDLLYTLRYRINTRNGLVLMYEALCQVFEYQTG